MSEPSPTPIVLRDLSRRLARLTPDTSRCWGTLTAHEMLCHLGDATAMVLRDRPRVVPVDGGARRLFAIRPGYTAACFVTAGPGLDGS